MRNSAPAVAVELQPDRFFAATALLLCACALLALVVWTWVQLSPDHDSADHLTAIALTCSALAAMTLLAGWRLLATARHPGLIRGGPDAPTWQATHLNWDGQTWALVCLADASRQACQVNVRLDAGRWLLLQLRALPGQLGSPNHTWTCWIALARDKLPANWHALRCALYSARTPPDRINDR